jgi:hypothetical protein
MVSMRLGAASCMLCCSLPCRYPPVSQVDTLVTPAAAGVVLASHHHICSFDKQLNGVHMVCMHPGAAECMYCCSLPGQHRPLIKLVTRL